MAKTILKYEITDSCDCNQLIFLDLSSYGFMAVNNPIVRIFTPDFDSYKQLNYNLRAITVIEPSHIGFESFPSGLYRFVQSIAPNDKTEVHTCWLNICPEIERLATLGCELSLDKKECRKSNPTSELTDIYLQLLLAKAMVGEDPDKACILFSLAKEKIDALESDCLSCK